MPPTGRLPAQQLLHGRRHQRRVGSQLPALVGVLAEVAEEAVERRAHGVEPGDEEEEADVEDVVAGELVAVDLGVEEAAEQVVAPLDLAVVEHIVEVRVDRRADLVLVGDGVGVLAALADDVVGPDDAVLHRQERRQVRERQPEQGEEHLRRQRHRELGREVALPAVDEACRSARARTRRPAPRARPCGAARTAGRGSCGTSRGRAGRSAAG